MKSLPSDHGTLANTPPWQQSWPSDQLENVLACPVCECSERVKGHENLVDNVFYCAPGTWDSWRCVRCGAYYLDPRPTPASIQGAYQTYYTHQSVDTKVAYGALSGIRRLRRRLVNAYTNWRFSTREEPSDKIGVVLLWLLRAQRNVLEWDYRHLPRMPAGGGVLLDVGCGNGSFLSIARSCGWLAIGVDPDPIACVRARGQGFEVHQGGVEYFDDEFNKFHAITMSHVIEHVHDPVPTLKSCYRLLKPGGQLWLETPNIDSLGHRRYGRNWRGLEPPRHLVLFNPGSLRAALQLAGFQVIVRKTRPSPLLSTTRASEAIQQGLSINDNIHLSLIQQFSVLQGRMVQAVIPRSVEFLTVVAYKR